MRSAFIALLLAGCGAQSSRIRPPEHPLVILTEDADGASLRTPSLEVRLGGRPLVVMLDTGATQHFVIGGAAWEHGVETVDAHDHATDTHGQRIPFRVARPGALRIGGVAPPHVFVFDSARFFFSGVYGGVSPQLLAPRDHATLLDFAAGRLSVVPHDTQPRWARAADLDVCRAGEHPDDGFRYVATLSIEDVEARMMVDTGAESTVLLAGAPAARPILERLHREESQRVLAGALGEQTEPSSVSEIEIVGAASSETARFVRGVDVRLGGASFSEEVGLEERTDAECEVEGVLGWNLLSRCRLALRRDGGALVCDASAEAMAQRAPRSATPRPATLTALRVVPVCGLSREQVTPGFDSSALPHRYDSSMELFAALHPQLESIAERLRGMCHDRGYLDAELAGPVLRRGTGSTADEVVASVELAEGRRYAVRSVRVVWQVENEPEREASAGELASLRTQVGDPWSLDDLMRDYDTLLASANRRGLASAGFGYEAEPDEHAAMVDVELYIYQRRNEDAASP